MEISKMQPPNSREEFEHNLFLLGEIINMGKMRIAPGISTDGLVRIRKLPNGRVDLLSIDEATRLKANIFAHLPSGLDSLE
jgi:hypothetical protein